MGFYCNGNLKGWFWEPSAKTLNVSPTHFSEFAYKKVKNMLIARPYVLTSEPRFALHNTPVIKKTDDYSLVPGNAGKLKKTGAFT